MPIYNPRQTEQKWQSRWEEAKIYHTNLEDFSRPKYYNLVMFPYPSGDKLHIGHWYNFAPADSWGRYMRMKGFNVFEPQGYDSFGLPAENYAIKTGVHPTVSIAKNIEYMRKQLRVMGPMYDYDKEIVTSDPIYYRWTQWVFLQLYKRGLAYRKTAPVNWCPVDQTVLANEQVVDGCCERCKHEVTKKDLTQWFFRIRGYAERLLNFEGLDWPERTKLMQTNWIGKSIGSSIEFELCDAGGKTVEIGATSGVDATSKVKVFTTRIDTLFGATYVVLAPEHPLVEKLTTKKHLSNVRQYIEKTRKETDIARSAEDREKHGVETGAYAINPINGKVLPIWIADYVLVTYGTGAVMAVPAHDDRDFAFAKKYNLPIIPVIAPAEKILKAKTGTKGTDVEETLRKKAEKNLKEAAFTDDGVLIESGKFSGLDSEEARKKITEYLREKESADFTINYKLRDWLISRQRYWGAPIPIIYCEKCGQVPVLEEDLPVELPKDVDFTPKGDGKSPLNTVPSFVNAKCPECGGKASREVDTMDTFVDSSWYFLRYPSARMTDHPFDPEKTKNWLPVDMYIGGPEHACMHLLYARFITMVLHDMDFIDFDEPFRRLMHQGMITKDGAKMSKSKGNVVSPDSFVERYGSDVFRMYLMFMGPFSEGGDWNDKGITGIARFVEKFYLLATSKDLVSDSEGLKRNLHRTIKKVTEDIDKFQFNTAISALMSFVNATHDTGIDDEAKRAITLLIAPLAPHLAEEIWEHLGGKFTIFDHSWPKYNPALIVDNVLKLVVQVNGKLRGQIEVPTDASKEEILAAAKAEPGVARHLESVNLVKEIYVPGKLVSLVVK
jgi:leucyl-tRNA synthetase